MTREDAIYMLRMMRMYNLNFIDLNIKDKNEAIDMAIESLSAEPCDDAISREQAASEYANWYGYNYQNNFFYKRLRSMPSVTPKQNDVLEKIRTVINEPAIYDEYSKRQNDYCDGYEFMRKRIKEIVDAEPKQKMGRWIREKKHHKDDFQEFDYWDVRCSECGARKRIGWMGVKYCPNCGAKMEGGAND